MIELSEEQVKTVVNNFFSALELMRTVGKDEGIVSTYQSISVSGETLGRFQQAIVEAIAADDATAKHWLNLMEKLASSAERFFDEEKKDHMGAPDFLIIWSGYVCLFAGAFHHEVATANNGDVM